MMEKLVMAFFLMASLVSNHSTVAKRRPIRSVLAPAETIDNYETVSPVTIYQSAETTQGHPHNLWIKLDMPYKPFELHLTMNRNLLSPQYTETSFENGNIVYNKEHKNCFYHGTVVGFAEWTVAMSTCTGLRGTFGNHGDIETLYHIEPFGRTSNEIEQTHVVFDSSVLSVERRNGTCGCNHSHMTIPQSEHNFSMPFDRVKRQSATRIVEWFIFNDRRQFVAQGQDYTQTAMHSIEIANIVDMLYAKIGIRVTLVGIQTWKQDLITVVSNPDTLLNNFHAYLRSTSLSYDSTMLITGITLLNGAVGFAPVGAMCSKISGGLTVDGGSSVVRVASTAAHELGHILNMRHDNNRNCSCAGINNACIMTAAIPQPPPMEWSSCSIKELNDGYAINLDRCLFNEPTSKCGNGVREGDEMCDCGPAETCDNPCCNASTCQFADGAVCFNHEACCSNCQFRTSGTVCRLATNDCDIAEYCTGNSAECPADRFRQDGADCANGQAYCFNKICQDLNPLCKASFAPFRGISPSAGPQECFNLNTRGQQLGNCGHNSNAFLACAALHVRCGQLQCQNGGQFITPIVAKENTRSIFIAGKGFVRCKSFTTLPGAATVLGLVPEGAKCGNNMMCKNRQCVTRQLTACPSANSDECSGNGVCNDMDQCSCNPGFNGISCNSTITGEKVDGNWTQWSSWSSCSVTCGVGSRTRTRNCTNPSPQGGGADCISANNGTDTCNMAACPVHGGWGSWISWSSCDATCGGGLRTRQRYCDNPAPSGGGRHCSGRSSQQEKCNTASCPVNGGWGSWTRWSSCDATCGGGQRTRRRYCDNPAPSGGGSDCSGSNRQRENCNTANCPVNGGWGSWTSWSSCDATCGGGQRTRQRYCDNPAPSGGGIHCSGSSSQQESCNIASCPVNGGWGSWTRWSSCDATCGGGQRTRQRYCDSPPPSGGGNDCSGSNRQQENCNTAKCPVNGGWGLWTRWSSCDATCGGGQRTRQRSCDNPAPSGGGSDCSGSNRQQENCNIANCPVNGEWGSWTRWSSCDATCGGGQRTRQRYCDNPAPSGRGSDCSGSGSEQQSCNTVDCPDINECLTDNGGCDHICVNMEDSFECLCNDSYILAEDNKTCIKTFTDINECLTDNGGCGHICVNTKDSFECLCNTSYILAEDNKTCIEDINECLDDNGGCDHICINTQYSFECLCHTSYILAEDNKTCTENITDINECLTDNGGCDHICVNTKNSFKCLCNDSYIVGEDNKTCIKNITDINECITDNGGCDHICVNTQDSFECLCNASYILAEDNKTCIENITITDCNYIVEESDGRIHTSGFPNVIYAPNSNCTWIINLPAYKSIELRFDDIAIKESTSCTEDRVTILNGKDEDSLILGSYCGSKLPASIQSSTGAVTIKFISYGAMNNRGFSLQYKGLTERSKGEYGCVMAPSTTTKFALSTFPSIYNNSVNCVYYFLPRNRVKLTFLYLDIQSADCSKDRIEIYNGIQFNNPDIMICNGSVTVEFVSSSYIVVVRYIGTSLGRYRGFHALARYL